MSFLPCWMQRARAGCVFFQFSYDQAGSTDKELVTLHNSGHCLTVDSEWESVAAKTHEFIQAHR